MSLATVLYLIEHKLHWKYRFECISDNSMVYANYYSMLIISDGKKEYGFFLDDDFDRLVNFVERELKNEI